MIPAEFIGHSSARQYQRFFVAILLFALQAQSALSQQSFTIVALPDTQNYVNDSNDTLLFNQQTQWIADQIQVDGNPRNIQFVTHLGDVVSSGSNLTQWNRADSAMSNLDGVVPYGVLPGNHDYASTGSKSTGTANYVNFFGPTRFAGQSFYGGADPSGNNSYQTFSAGGFDFIHMSLEWQPTINAPFRETSPIEWAQSVIDANPNTPVILSTHEHIDDDPAGRSGAGQATWDQLIRHNDQIFMVLNGHYHSVGGTNDGEYHQTSLNDADRTVFEILQDYQDYPNGGDGWLRLIEFDVPENKIRFETYSPVLDQFQTETVAQVGQFASQFDFDIDFADRLAPVIISKEPVDPGEIPTYLFQNGINGYAGTQDKEIRSSGGDSANGQSEEISIDGDDGSPGLQPNHGLIRFDSFIGNGQGQVPDGAQIASALLTLEVTNGGSGFTVHEMLTDWSESSTWTSFINGVQANDVEATSDVIAMLGDNNSSSNVQVGTLEIDVTESVQAFLDGDRSNQGWALLPFAGGTNGIDFFTSEFADINARPALQIFTLPGDYDLNGVVEQADYDLWQSEYGVNGFSLADGNKDGIVDTADYTIWRDAFDAAPITTVPEPRAWVLLGTLVVGLVGRRSPL